MERESSFRVEIASPEPDMPGFPAMPGLSTAMQPFIFLSWLPTIFTVIAVFVLALFFQIIFNVLTQPTAPITYGAIAAIFLVALATALVIWLLFSIGTKWKNSHRMRPIRID